MLLFLREFIDEDNCRHFVNDFCKPRYSLKIAHKIPIMKLAQRLVSVLFIIIACVVGGSLLLQTSETALAQECSVIPQPDLNQGYEIPENPKLLIQCTNVRIGSFAWQTFVALNWPANSNGDPLQQQTIGEVRDQQRVWESYEFPEDVFKDEQENGTEQYIRYTENGAKFGSPPESQSSILEGRTAPLIDRQGNYILSEVHMNPVEVEQISKNDWNSVKVLQEQFGTGNKPFQLMCSALNSNGTYPIQGSDSGNYADNIPCLVEDGNDSVGAIEIKVAWKVLPSEQPKPSQYYTTMRELSVRTPEDSEGETTQVKVPVALVGFHILHKTSQLGWIWSTLEHIDNAPSEQDLPTTKHYNLYDPDCQQDCQVNTPLATKPYLWQIKTPNAVTEINGQIKEQTPSQITRTIAIPDYAEQLNEKWQRALPSPWDNYELIGVQWVENPFVPTQDTQKEGNVKPAKLANTTLEPYAQTVIPSCITCHTSAQLPISGSVSADFSFLMRHAKHSSP